VRLPQLAGGPGAVPTPDGPLAQGDRPVQPLKVLVVDDNADAANTLNMLLDASGHQAFAEYTATAAIERTREVHPQVCVLDIGLPDMDGCELARRLRAMPGMGKATLIAVSGYGQEQDKRRSADAGFDYHLVKPIDTGKLLALLAQAPVA
jgi:CheY-like chemotaxis protein